MAYTPYVSETEYNDRGNTEIPATESGTLVYATPTDYDEIGYSLIPSPELTIALRDASRMVDKLTFNRIVKRGFENLTEFQQEIIKEVVCKQANFIYQNSDAINSVLDSYAINGVSMKFGVGFNVSVISGVPIQASTYSLLEQTGLCWRGAI